MLVFKSKKAVKAYGTAFLLSSKQTKEETIKIYFVRDMPGRFNIMVTKEFESKNQMFNFMMFYTTVKNCVDNDVISINYMW